jgi:putative ABC transport system permease protein
MRYLFKTIIRNFRRKPVTNLINLFGLAISFTAVIILSVYCYSELTTDNFQKNGERVYLFLTAKDGLYTPAILKDNIDQKVAEVESTVRIGGTWEAPVFQIENSDPIVSDLIFADVNFFNLFTYNFIEGSESTALLSPLSIVITESLSENLFGTAKALGKQIKVNNDKILTVSGVIEVPKHNSCLSFSAVSSMDTRKIVMENGGEFTEWGYWDFQTFVLLRNKVDPQQTQKAISSLFPESAHINDAQLLPMKKIYFSKLALLGDNFLRTGDRKRIIILVLVASLVLAVALINFILISTAQWQERIKQTGVLKVIGAKQFSIFSNILAESFIFFFAAMLIAIDIVNIINPFILNYTGINYNARLTLTPGFLAISIGFIIIFSVGFSGLPALRIATTRAVDDLKNLMNNNRTKFSFRGLLVTIQFFIAIALIAFTVLVQKQVRFGCTSLGFNKENIIGIKLTEQLGQKKDVLKKALSDMPMVSKISFSQYFPGKVFSEWTSWVNSKGERKEISFNTFSADSRFFDMLNLQLVKGRLYDENLSSDKKKIVVNEAFLQKIKMENPLDATIDEGMIGEKVFQAEIVGVIKDFHLKSIDQPITPLVIRNEPAASYCLLTSRAGDFKSLNDLLNKIKTTASELSPSFPVEISFLDLAIENMYKSELRFRHTFSLLAACAIVLCCLGILAMSLFGCQRRIKEIGIRKVNGARISQILFLLNRDFVKWVGIAFLMACPVAWYASDRWLQSFAYKTTISWWVFAFAGLIALGIALLTVSWQSWRAATRNPVEALRYE